MYFITIKRMLEVCFSAHPNIQYRAQKYNIKAGLQPCSCCGPAFFFFIPSKKNTISLLK